MLPRGRLKTLRQERGLSLTGLAAASGLTKGFISQVEAGHSTPSLASLGKLAQALGVAPGELITEPSPRMTDDTQTPRAYRTPSLSHSSLEITHIATVGEMNYINSIIDVGCSLVSPRGLGEGSRTPGTIVGVIRRGLLRVRQNGIDMHLSTGDIATWGSLFGYEVKNEGNSVAELLLCLPVSASRPVVRSGTSQHRSRGMSAIRDVPNGPFRLVTMRQQRHVARRP